MPFYVWSKICNCCGGNERKRLLSYVISCVDLTAFFHVLGCKTHMTYPKNVSQRYDSQSEQFPGSHCAIVLAPMIQGYKHACTAPPFVKKWFPMMGVINNAVVVVGCSVRSLGFHCLETINHSRI